MVVLPGKEQMCRYPVRIFSRICTAAENSHPLKQFRGWLFLWNMQHRYAAWENASSFLFPADKNYFKNEGEKGVRGATDKPPRLAGEGKAHESA